MLRKACPDFDEWPTRWQYEAADLAPGIAIIAIFKPFLLDLLHSKASKSAFNRHRDSLWHIGGEIIRLRHDDPAFHRIPVNKLVRVLIEDDCGPLIWPRISETQQNTIDATSRKLFRFLNQSDPPV